MRFVSILLVSMAFGCTGPTASSSLIRASEGGAVTASSHGVTIPAGSLAADTEVTLDTAPASDYPALTGLLAEVLRIEPEGTVLEIPASITIEGSFVGAPAGSTVSVWQLSNADGVMIWGRIESTRDSASGDVTTAVSRFAPLGVVVATAPVGAGIRGTISWGDGTPVDMAPIQLMQGGSLLTTATSGADGSFAFADVSPGEYELVVDYECRINRPVTVVAGEAAEVTLTLCGS